MKKLKLFIFFLNILFCYIEALDLLPSALQRYCDCFPLKTEVINLTKVLKTLTPENVFHKISLINIRLDQLFAGLPDNDPLKVNQSLYKSFLRERINSAFNINLGIENRFQRIQSLFPPRNNQVNTDVDANNNADNKDNNLPLSIVIRTHTLPPIKKDVQTNTDGDANNNADNKDNLSPVRRRFSSVGSIRTRRAPAIYNPPFMMRDVIPDSSSKVPNITFKDLAGGPPLELIDLKRILAHDPDYVAVGAKKPFGVVFYGLPGTGKSFSGRALAGELKVPFLYVSASEFINKYVGVGADNVRKLFDDANNLTETNNLVIIFVDEIDSIAKRREAEGNEESTRTINQFMTKMDGDSTINKEKLVVIVATNMKDLLDEAFKRRGRFDEFIEFKLPDSQVKKELFNRYFNSVSRKVDEEIEVDEIIRRTEEFILKDIEGLIDVAAKKAARARRGFLNKDFYEVIEEFKKERRKDNELSPPPPHMYM